MLKERLIWIFAALAAVVAAGTGGYVIMEGWPPLDALYMTVITISSVGFMEVHPLSDKARIFTVFLILCGSGILIYAVSILTAFIVEGELTDVLRRRKMNNRIALLDRHYIVCGADLTGRYAIEELVKTKKPFVVIEKDREKVRRLSEQGTLYIEGDATHDGILLKAGIAKAKGLVTALHSDAENLFVVITAKRLNPALRVISKAVEEESEQKIRMVGADGVVMPDFIGGLRMVSEMVRPSVVNFLDIMLRARDKTVRVEEIVIEPHSPFAGKVLSETGLHEMEDMSIVALKGGTGDAYTFNPSRATVLGEGHVLIVMGNVDRIGDATRRINPAGDF
ncbi:MAG: potassium channel protein [Nitrospiraceae bacterium]|nr:potassium channel protein [Nitrospiraceae bacterium]